MNSPRDKWPYGARTVKTPYEVWTMAMGMVRECLCVAEAAETKAMLTGLHSSFEASRLITSMQEDITDLAPGVYNEVDDPEFEETEFVEDEA